MAIGDGNELNIVKEIHFPHSLGLLYSAFTYYAGFDKKFIEIKKNITKPIFYEVDVYGNNPDKDHGSDQVIIIVFRKK